MKLKDKIIVIVVGLILVIISIIITFIILKSIKNIKGKPEDIAYMGKINNKMDYEVFIIPNLYIEQSKLKSDNSYITSLIDYINLNYNYNYSFDRDVNINYSYKIEANIVGLFGSDSSQYLLNPVLNKKYTLLHVKTIKVQNKLVNINENLKIDLKPYNAIISAFQSDYNIALTSSLEIKLTIDYEGIINNKKINNEHYLLVSIPLAVKGFDITTSTNFKETETIYLNNIPNSETIFVKTIILIAGDLILIFIGYMIIKKIIEKYSSKYLLNINKILKEYDNRIVEVKNIVKYSSWENIDVTSFEELINLSDEAFEPILFWENRKRNSREAWFCILRDKVIYRYIIKRIEN